MYEHEDRSNPFGLLVGVVGAGTGYAMTQYTGTMSLMPLAGALLSGFLVDKLVPAATKPIVPAFAIQVGQGIWLALGAAALRRLDSISLDLGLLTTGLVWLILRPGLGPVLLLLLYQSVGFIVGWHALTTAEFGGMEHKTRVVQLVLQASAMILMVAGLKRVRQSRELSAPSFWRHSSPLH
jgi:hypothetical protein